MEPIIVLGGSLAGVRAAVTLRSEGYNGKLIIIDRDSHAPYDRVPLSKQILVGAWGPDDIRLATDSIDAAWIHSRSATSVDLRRRIVRLSDGTCEPFSGLVIAPDMALDGVFALRTLTDAIAIRSALLARPARVTVVGGGLIGSEIATATCSLGIATTIVDANQLPLGRTVGRTVSESIARLHAERAVRVVPGRRVVGLVGRNGSVRAVQLDNGDEIPSDVVLVALGVVADTEWLEGSGLTCNPGLVCEPTLYASGSDSAVGAGDVTRWRHPLSGNVAVRAECWATAMDQAELAAKNLLRGVANATPFLAVPTFGSRIHGFAVRSVGFPQLATESEVLAGSVDDRAYVVGFRRHGALVGAVALSATDQPQSWRTRMSGAFGSTLRGRSNVRALAADFA
jgi:NADPH-dependent 2,4-dienoyl-CoA reductase/sulfur reductase-like enzyme